MATNAATVADGLEVLHADGGGEFTIGVKSVLSRRGPQKLSHGNGSVKSILFQYDFSLANLLAKMKDADYWGEGPNATLSLFGMVNWVKKATIRGRTTPTS